MIGGSCLCGGVRFEVDSVAMMTFCHCSRCRKAFGSAFEAAASVREAEFRFVQGEELVRRYESSPGSVRSFCRVCGSPAPSVAMRGVYFVPAGLLDDDPGVRPSLHMFVGSKAPWWEIDDDLPKFDQWVPGFGPQDQE